MSRAFVVAVLCCAAAFAAAPPGASAAAVAEGTCVATATWSLTPSSATVVYDPYFCYDVSAAASLEQVLPEFRGGPDTFPSATLTYGYTPVVGLCIGRLNSSTTTGVLKNDGNFHTSVTLAVVDASPPATTVAIEHAATFQNPCSSSFETTAVFDFANATP